MSELLNRFSLSTAQWNAQVAAAAFILWAAIVACAISSIRTQPFTPQQRRFWTLLVIFLPIAGILAYLPFSFQREDIPHAFAFTPKNDRNPLPPKRLKVSQEGEAL